MAHALEQVGVSVWVELFVEKDDGTWLNLSDCITHDRLLACSPIEARLDAGLGFVDVPAITLTLDNADRFWNGPPPSGISTWYRHRVRLERTSADGTDILGTFQIDGAPQTSTKSFTATLRCRSTLDRLNDKTAARVRDGQSPHTNTSLGLLVQALLRQEFPSASVDSWLANDTISRRYRIPLADTSARKCSTFARLPEARSGPGPCYGNPLLRLNDGKLLTAVDGQVWSWDPLTEEEVAYDSLVTAGLSADYQIHHLWWNDALGAVVGVAWAPDVPAATYSGPAERSGAVGGDVRFFTLDGTSLYLFDALVPAAGQEIFTGHYAVRAGAKTGGSPQIRTVGRDPGYYLVAGLDALSAGINVPVPFGQWLWIAVGGGGATATYAILRATAWNGTTGSLVDNSTSLGTHNRAVRWQGEPAEYLGYQRNKIVGTFTDPLDYRFSLGQMRGAFAMQHAGIYLAFYTIEWDATNQVYHHQLWRLDCTSATGAPIYEYYDTSGGHPAWVAAGSGGAPYVEAHSGGQDLQPYCAQFSPDDASLLVGSSFWGEAPWSAGAPAATQIMGHILEHVFAAPNTATVIFDGSDTSDPNDYAGAEMEFAIPLTVDYNPQDASLIFCTFFLPATNGYVAGLLDTNSGTTTSRWQFADVRHSQGAPLGVVYDDVANKWLWLESGSNLLLSVDGFTNSDVAIEENDGAPPVYQDSSLSAGLVIDTSSGTGVLYGISGPGLGAQPDPSVAGSEISGKRLLWMFNIELSDRIECADWDDSVTLKQALAQLAGVGDFVFYVGLADDQFYFQLRAGVSSAFATWIAQGLALEAGSGGYGPTLLADEIAAPIGYEEIVNYVEITPSHAILGPPTVGARVLPRPETWGRDVWTGAVIVAQNTSKRVHVVLRCVQGGVVGNADAGCVVTNGAGHGLVDASPDATHDLSLLRFSYLEYAVAVETQLLQDTATGGGSADEIRVPLSAVTDVTVGPVGYGDTVHIDIGVDRTILSMDITSVSATAILALDSNVSGSTVYLAGQLVTIRTAQNNRWSDAAAGVTTLDLALPATNPTLAGNGGGVISATQTDFHISAATGVDVNTVFLVGTERIRVLAVTGTHITDCQRNYGGTPAAGHTDGDIAAIQTVRLASSAPIGTRALLRIGTLATYEDIRLVSNLDIGDGKTVLALSFACGGTTRSAHSVGDPVKAYWAPVVNADFPAGTLFGIGASGIQARLEMPGTSTSVHEPPVMIGDEIDITCPGLTLQQDAHATVVEQDVPSQTLYQRRPWKGQDSPLLTFVQAVEVAKRRLRDFAYPRRLPHITGPDQVTPSLQDPYLVRDYAELPWVQGVTTPNRDAWASPATGDTTTAILARVRGHRRMVFSDSLEIDFRAVNPVQEG